MNYAIANILLNNVCNLKCKHCYLDKNTSPTFLDLGSIDSILKYLKKYNVKSIVWSGGEPLLNSNLLNILKLSSSYDFNNWIFSNGTLITREFLNSTQIYLQGFFISIDGLAHIHDYCRGYNGAFSKVDNSLRLLNELQVPFQISTTVYNKNFYEVENIINYAYKYGCTNFIINAASSVGNAKSLIQLSTEQLFNLRHRFIEIIKKYNYHIKIKTNILTTQELLINNTAIYESLINSLWIDSNLNKSLIPNFISKVNIFDNSDSILINKTTFEKILKKIENNNDDIFNFDYLFEEYLLKEVNYV